MWNVDCTIATVVDCALVVVALVASPVIMFAFKGRWKPWYDSLVKAPWNPPDAVFGIVWTLLYLLIGAAGITARYYYEQPSNSASFAVSASATVLYYVMWALLLSWTPVFFLLRSIIGALVILIFIVLVSVTTDALFWVIHSLPGGLLLPHLVWIFYALSLNIYIVAKNGAKLRQEDAQPISEQVATGKRSKSPKAGRNGGGGGFMN